MSRRVWFGVLLVAAVLLGAYLSAARRTEGPPLDPRSTSADGARAVVELVSRFGTMDVLDSVPTDGIDTALVLQDRFDRDAEAQLRSWVEDGGTLVVADPGSTFTPPVVGTSDGEVAVACDGADLAGVGALETGDGLLLDAAGASATCTATGDGGGALVVVEDLGAGRIVSVGGPDPFTNRHLDEADNAVLAVALLVPEAGARSAFLRPGIAVGTGDRGLVDLVGTPVRAALAQLAVAFVLAALWRGRRLGRPVPEPQPVRVEAAELTEAVGRLLGRSRRPARAAAVLRDRARRDLSPVLGVTLDAPVDLVVDAVAARTTLTPDEARRATAAPVTDDADLVEVATLLARIREETTHGRRPADQPV